LNNKNGNYFLIRKKSSFLSQHSIYKSGLTKALKPLMAMDKSSWGEGINKEKKGTALASEKSKRISAKATAKLKLFFLSFDGADRNANVGNPIVRKPVRRRHVRRRLHRRRRRQRRVVAATFSSLDGEVVGDFLN
jgi:hypothetical protein